MTGRSSGFDIIDAMRLESERTRDRHACGMV
jgi:hypothetical protein